MSNGPYETESLVLRAYDSNQKKPVGADSEIVPRKKVKLSNLNGGKDVRLIAILGDSYMSKDQLKKWLMNLQETI